MHYQPEVALAHGRVVGAEALARWRGPDGGLRQAGDFLARVEEGGLMVDLGTWVLRTACLQAAAWDREAPGRLQTLRVNLSATQLAHPDLVAVVAGALGAADLEPATLCLEVAEPTLLADLDGALGALRALHDLDVGLAVDDVGTGSSSLAYLRRLPISAVKVDRRFVAGLGTDPGDTAVVAGVVGRAHALGLSVVAEGVERPEQAAELRRLGCDLAVGWLFSPAVAAEHFWEVEG